MSFQIGIVGLPNVGKSTLFTALTRNKVEAANYPFCTIDPNVGIVEVPDKRLQQLTQVSASQKTIPTVIEFLDIAGLVKDAHKGEGLGNKFLSHIREVDAIVEVVRNFSDPNVTHVTGKINPEEDKETINLELIFADLETVNRRLVKVTDMLKGPHDKIFDKESILLNKIKSELETGRWLGTSVWTEEEKQLVKSLNLLTMKPLLYVYNIDEAELNQLPSQSDNSLSICAKLEAELVDLSKAEVKAYLAQANIQQTGLEKLITASYRLLSLITFFTSGPKESRAWTIPNGTKAPAAGGAIHSDFTEKFIRAEIISWTDFISYRGWPGCREAGKLRTEGKDYVIKDGDVILFKI